VTQLSGIGGHRCGILAWAGPSKEILPKSRQKLAVPDHGKMDGASVPNLTAEQGWEEGLPVVGISWVILYHPPTVDLGQF
jgi:hypothetical protein